MISIRRIRCGEASLYRDLRLAALEDSPDAFAETHARALARPAESWSKAADSAADGSDRAIFIAFSDEKAVGLAALYRHGATSPVGELLQVWLSPGFRNQGIGRLLIGTATVWAGSHQFTRVLAVVSAKNHAVIAFYERCGFGEATPEASSAQDEIILERYLTPDSAQAPDRQRGEAE